jgi:hypothetical protein
MAVKLKRNILKFKQNNRFLYSTKEIDNKTEKKIKTEMHSRKVLKKCSKNNKGKINEKITVQKIY